MEAEYKLFRVYFDNGKDVYIRAVSFNKAAIIANEWYAVDGKNVPLRRTFFDDMVDSGDDKLKEEIAQVTSIMWVKNAVV